MKFPMFVRTILVLVFVIGSVSVSASTIIVNCTITQWNEKGATTLVVPVEAWGAASETAYLMHATHLFEKGDKRYSIWIPFSDDLSKTRISVGHPQAGGVATDYSAHGDLNKAPLGLDDIQNNVDISCVKN